MPNSQDLRKYPVLLFDAFEQASHQPTVTLHATSPTAARNLRSLCYTLRKLLAASPEEWHQQLAASIADRKFYISASSLIIAAPMLTAQQSAFLEPTNDNPPH